MLCYVRVYFVIIFLWPISKNIVYLVETVVACSRLSVKKQVGDEWGLVEKEGAMGEPVSIVFKTSFWYISSWYSCTCPLWLVTLLKVTNPADKFSYCFSCPYDFLVNWEGRTTTTKDPWIQANNYTGALIRTWDRGTSARICKESVPTHFQCFQVLFLLHI